LPLCCQACELLCFVAIIVSTFAYVLFKQNQKDKKKLEKELNDDYPKPKDEGPKT
jgi:hypothetical protein